MATQNSKVLPKFIFTLILALAIFVRFYRLGEIPVALNRDEASIGYNAYLLLKTGQEEHGQSWPLNLQSFGDWKLPVYVYSAMPAIQLFGLSEWSVRLPSAVAGVGLVLAVYWLMQLVLAKEKNRNVISLLAALFVAISPWSIHFSRIAYEANIAMLLFVLGCVFYLKTLQRTKAAFWYAIFTTTAFSLTLFTYHSYQLVTPAFLLLLAVIDRRELAQWWRDARMTVLVSGSILALSVVILILSQRTGANETKYKNISIFSRDIENYEQSVKRMLLADANPILEKVFGSHPVVVGQRLYNNLISFIDPQFLFTQGGSHQSHNIPGFGNLYAFAVITLPAGIYFALSKRAHWQKVMIGWILVAMIPPLMTYSPDVSTNHSTRFSAALVPLEILSAYGIGLLLLEFKQRAKKPFFISSLLVSSFTIGYTTLFFLSSYFFIYPVRDKDRWPWYMKEIVQAVESESDQTAQIIMTGESSSPYIYFLFYNPEKYLPLSEYLHFYSMTDEGFRHAQQLGRIEFGSVNWNELEKKHQSVLLMLREKEIPIDKKEHRNYKVVRTISDPYSSLRYVLLKYDP